MVAYVNQGNVVIAHAVEVNVINEERINRAVAGPRWPAAIASYSAIIARCRGHDLDASRTGHLLIKQTVRFNAARATAGG